MVLLSRRMTTKILVAPTAASRDSCHSRNWDEFCYAHLLTDFNILFWDIPKAGY